MIQFYRWTLSFPPLAGPQNPRAVRLVNKLIGNTTCTTCLKPLFGKNDHFASPRQPLTGILRIFPGLCLTFLPSAASAVASDFWRYAPLIFWRYVFGHFCHSGLVSMDASRHPSQLHQLPIWRFGDVPEASRWQRFQMVRFHKCIVEKCFLFKWVFLKEILFFSNLTICWGAGLAGGSKMPDISTGVSSTNREVHSLSQQSLST